MDQEKTWYETLKENRTACGLSQKRLAEEAGVSCSFLCEIENGKKSPSPEIRDSLLFHLVKLSIEEPLDAVIDYLRIRFPTQDIRLVMEQIMRIQMRYTRHEDYGFYGYQEHYFIGDIIVMVSSDEKKGILLELKGRGSRQFEGYLVAQGRDWYSFFEECKRYGGVLKRVDIAINDKVGILSIPELVRKCEAEECISVFTRFKNYRSGEIAGRDEKEGMGETLYIGSMKSEVYFCVYEKDYEQYIRNGSPVSEAEVKNRFEIRLKNDRASVAVEDLLEFRDIDKTAFEIINRYLQFICPEEGKKKADCKLDSRWAYFIGEGRGQLRLTMKPEPYTVDRTYQWIQKQVAPTVKMLQDVDLVNGTNVINDIFRAAKQTDRHKKLVEQLTVPVDETIIKNVGVKYE